MNQSLHIALLQLPSISPTDALLEKYLQACKKQKIQLVAFGEYVLNPFYKELNTSHSSEMIIHRSDDILSQLKKLSKKYKLDMITPLLLGENKKLYKSIALIQADKSTIYHQQRLIAYPHWNEKKFFNNKTPKVPRTPLIFDKGGLKIAILSGFEIHFDELWLKLKNAKVDAVILPCANTFQSQDRWRALCQMRAFCNSMAILRINRIGTLNYDDTQWKFYGDSLFINADGEIRDSLGEKEGMMLVSLEANKLKAIQQEWGFR